MVYGPEKYYPLELTALARQMFAVIHPFADGQGRVARLIMNAVLSQANF
jgi:Fic family protein